jgi:hypothetical protein
MMRDLLSLLGFLFAGFCFFAWYGTQRSEATPPNDFAAAGIFRGEDHAIGRQPLQTPTELPLSKSGATVSAAVPVEPTTSKPASDAQIRRRIKDLSDLAVLHAMDDQRLIPAGVSLALLIQQSEKGKQLHEDNLRKVIDYLVSIKYAASKDDLARYFKYASNSKKWFQGLALARHGGHQESELLRIYNAYQLEQYDQGVRSYVTATGSEQLQFDRKLTPRTAAPAVLEDADNEELKRNVAHAKNRWAEKESKGTAAEVTFLPAKNADGKTTNAVRKRVQALAPGESLTFDDPAQYHAAVREMIALEQGYDTWSSYEAYLGKDKAGRVFRKRAEKGGLMATGTLKLTRER